MKKRFLAAVMTVLLILVMAMPAMAADFDYAPDNEAEGTTTKLHKYLVVDKDTVSPAITFTYSIAAGTEEKTAAAGKLPVYAGIGTPTVADVAFAAGDASTAGAADKPITDTSKLYAAKDITIDFSSVTFPKPGIYRYILTEAKSNTEGVGGVLYDVAAPDGAEGDCKRTIDVYVIDTDGVLSVQGYVAYKGEITGQPAQAYDPNGVAADGYANGSTAENATGIDEKSNQYINQIKTNTMTVKKVIAGNQGDRESKWKVKVDFENLPTGVTVKYALIENNGAAPTTITYADYTSGTELTIGHNDKYKFIGIPEGVKYTVTETDANKEGYTTTYANETYTFAKDTTVENKDDAVITNTRNGVIPTGVFTAVGGGVALIALALVYFAISRRRVED